MFLRFMDKRKKEVVGTLYDCDGNTYELIKEEQIINKNKEIKEDFQLYKEKEKIYFLDTPSIKFDLSKSSYKLNHIFVFKFLKLIPVIRGCLEIFKFPNEILLEIWDNCDSRTKDLIMKYQDIGDLEDYKNITLEQKWIYLNQNIYRTKEIMYKYKEQYIFLASQCINSYLDYVLMLYDDWQELKSTLVKYYTNLDTNEIINKATLSLTERIEKQNNKLELLTGKLKQIDLAFENCSITQKIRMAEEVKEIINEEKLIKEKIAELTKKIEKLKDYFSS
ncbi:MAG: hypothetical protein K0R54_557 [Clostridiaceae bacterium]|jgi:hypothetical protein|nr:hypothetical protein [Clostridiaceae bacterium]